jgi:hypothetical protein
MRRHLKTPTTPTLNTRLEHIIIVKSYPPLSAEWVRLIEWTTYQLIDSCDWARVGHLEAFGL